ncbi:MAG: AmmeMemoRadiSam system protein B [Pseudomonadota bacterium]
MSRSRRGIFGRPASYLSENIMNPFYLISVRRLFAGLGVLALSVSLLVAAEPVRESILAGTWYSKDSQTLRQEVTGFLQKVPVHERAGRLVALISPHAGYRYSGQVAAHAYKLLENRKFDTIVLIGPSHHHRFEGVSVYNRGDFQTPLGIVPLDHEIIRAIMEKDVKVRFIPEAHAREHSLEIQLPFLQTVMPGVRIVPLVMGDQGMPSCHRLAETLSACLKGKSVLLVASSDLSHFHSDSIAREMDQRVSYSVKKMDADYLLADLAAGASEACGGGPMAVVMLAAKQLGADFSEILSTATSGEVTGDRASVVGYMAAALWETSAKSAGADLPGKKADPDMRLSDDEKASLHRIARSAIEAALDGRSYHSMEKMTGPLLIPCGAFVTLKKKGGLRGCIGHIVGHYPLAETISQMAVAAALQDPRFPPVTRQEWPAIEIEISVLTPLKEITDPTAIAVGRHGIYIQKGDRSGLLLPQVATEYGWDRLKFLEQTCRKAGLPTDAWKDPGAKIQIFSAQIF